MPQASVDPVVLAAMIVLRLQTIVSREVAPTEPAVLTVGSIHAGTKSNVIADHAVLELNVRTYDEQTRDSDPGRRSGGSSPPSARRPARPRDPEFELYDRFPPTDQRRGHDRARPRSLRPTHFGDTPDELPLQTASEDFSDIPSALGVPVHLLGHRRHRPRDLPPGRRRPDGSPQDIPVNHSAALRPGHAAHPGHRHLGAGGCRPGLARQTAKPLTPTPRWTFTHDARSSGVPSTPMARQHS